MEGRSEGSSTITRIPGLRSRWKIGPKGASIGQRGDSRDAEGIQDDRFIRRNPFLHRSSGGFTKAERQVMNEPASIGIANFVHTVMEGLDFLAKFDFCKQGLFGGIGTVKTLFVLIPKEK
jgi:hypothetical protein